MEEHVRKIYDQFNSRRKSVDAHLADQQDLEEYERRLKARKKHHDENCCASLFFNAEGRKNKLGDPLRNTSAALCGLIF